VSLGVHTPRAGEHDLSARLRHHGNTVAVALMVATSAVATFDLYLFAASAVH